MAHELTAVSEWDQSVTFRCINCGATCEFVKPAFGDPNPVQQPDGSWAAPEAPETWMGPCTQ